jgi:hypothetical protein
MTSTSAEHTGASKLAQLLSTYCSKAPGSRESRSSAPFSMPSEVNSAAHWYLKTPVREEVTDPLRAVFCGSALFSGASE